MMLTIIGTAMAGVAWALTPAPPPAPPPEPPRYVYCLTCPAILTDLPETFLAPATTVMLCESRGRAGAVNPASGTIGLWQIHPIHRQRVERMGYTLADLTNPAVNLAVAYSIWAEQGWRPWSCKP